MRLDAEEVPWVEYISHFKKLEIHLRQGKPLRKCFNNKQYVKVGILEMSLAAAR